MSFTRPPHEVADVCREHGDAYRLLHHPTAAQRKVLQRLAACRTAALGGHVDACRECGHKRISYDSCRDRHCPKCQHSRKLEWLEQRLERLLPVPCFHVVFTLPQELRALALAHQELLYDMLFLSASSTLRTLARDPERLGADIGVTAVLHTWSQNLMLHPHLHCVVTGGGLSRDGTRWIPARARYFMPVKVLAKLFRGKFLSALQAAFASGKLRFSASTQHLAAPLNWLSFKDALYRKDWLVYAKRPFGGAKQVFAYLGRYTHKVAISNHRIVSRNGGNVTFTARAPRGANKRVSITVHGPEFLRRFLLHVLPKGFVRIRHYGLYAGRNVHAKLEAAHAILAPRAMPQPPTANSPRAAAHTPWWERVLVRAEHHAAACPACGGPLTLVETLAPIPHRTAAPPRAPPKAP